MQISIDITGIKELQAELKDISTRRLNSILATTLTRTAWDVANGWQKSINATIESPTPRTQKAVIVKQATATSLVAEVKLKDAMKGLAPQDYLSPHEFSGDRLLKKFEQALVKSGAMPSGFFVVPGRAAKLDGYGNVTRAQITHVITQLGMDYSPGYQRTISKSASKRMATAARHGRKYVAVQPGVAKRYKVSPGIYEMQADGSRKAVFLFKGEVRYRKRLKLMDEGHQKVDQVIQAQFSRAFNESMARLAQKV